MTKAKWRRKLAVLLSICVLGTSGAVPDPASITFAAFGGENSAATGSNADQTPEAGHASGTNQTLEPDMPAELATSSNAQGIIVEFEDYEDEESPMELICVDEDTPIEALPLPETLAVSVQKVEQQSETATPSDAAPNATPSDAGQASPSDADTDEDLLWEEEIELINDLENGAEKQEPAETPSVLAINPDAETISIDLPVNWVQADDESPYTGQDGEATDFIPTWDYKAYPLAEGYEPNLFVTVLVGDYPSLDQLEADEDKAASFVFSDEDTDQVEAVLDREIPVAHGSIFHPLMRFFQAADDYRFDNYYILYKNNLGTVKNDECQELLGNMSETRQLIKYQIDFHNDVQYEENQVEIRVPYSLYTDRDGKTVPFSDIGIPEYPNVSKSSSFSYKIEEETNEIVITNNKVIRAGSNNFLQIFYALDDLKTYDGQTWEIIPKLTITTAEGEQEGVGRTLTGSMDTGNDLTVTRMTAYQQNDKSYYPELYTVSQVEGALKNKMPDSFEKNFDKYRFILWITELNSESSQPWNLTIQSQPGEGGQVVGQYLGDSSSLNRTGDYFYQGYEENAQNTSFTWSNAHRYGFGSYSYSLEHSTDRGKAGVPVYLYTVAAYPKDTVHMTNTVRVTLKGIDEKEPAETLESSAEWGWENYEWNYQGNVIGIDKDYGITEYEGDDLEDSWLRVYKHRAEKQQKDTELPDSWTVQGMFRGFALSHNVIVDASPEKAEASSAKYEKNGADYTLGTADDVMYASSAASGGKKLLTYEDYYYSQVTVKIEDYVVDVYEDLISGSKEGDGADIYVMTAEQGMEDEWQKISEKPVPYEELLNGYRLPEAWLEKEIYRVRVEHTTDEYMTECEIEVKTVVRKDSPVFNEMLEQGAATISLENLGAVYGKTTNKTYAGKWIQQVDGEDDPNYKPYEKLGLKELTWKLYNDESYSSDDNTAMRRNDTVTLTDIREFNKADKFGKARNNAADSQVDITYQLTAYEGYRVYGQEAIPILEQNGIGPMRDEVVLYDLLPIGITFDPSRPVTVGSLTDIYNRGEPNSWETDRVKVTYKVLDDYKQSGRQLVKFMLEGTASDRENLESSNNQYDWWSGWGVEFGAYYSWDDIDIANGATNLMAYQVPDEKAILGGAHLDDGSWAPDNLKDVLADLDEDGDVAETNILWSSTAVSLDNAVASQAEIKKTVREDEDIYGIPDRYAMVQPGKGYTYTLTLTNGKNYLEDLVIFDRLENAMEDRKGQADEDMVFDENGDWQGEFVYTNVEALKERGIDVKVYYSEKRNAPIEDEANGLQGKALLQANPDIWIPEEKWDKKLADVKAVAYDLTTMKDGKDVRLEPMESLTLEIHMKAPAEMPATVRYAYNNPAHYETIFQSEGESGGGGGTKQTVIGDTARVELYNTTTLEVEKTEVTGKAASENETFPFLVTIGGKPYAYRAYTLMEKWGEEWKTIDGIYGTNQNGILFLKEGQKAVFSSVPIGAAYQVEEKAGFRWETEATGNIGMLEGKKIHKAQFKNTYHPLLYIEKEVLYAQSYTKPEDFTFTLKINGAPAGNCRYYKVNPEADMKKEPEILSPEKVFTTEDDGTFTLKGGERICVLLNAGDTYEVTESALEYGPETDYDCDAPRAAGQVKDTDIYAYAKITNIYRYKELQVSKIVTSMEGGQVGGSFVFQLKMGKDKGHLEPCRNQEFYPGRIGGGVFEDLSGKTDADGIFTVAKGNYVVFRNLERGMYYQVEELGVYNRTDKTTIPLEKSDFQVISPAGGIGEGTIPKYALSARVEFENRHKGRALRVKKTVVSSPDNPDAGEGKRFNFFLEKKDSNGKFQPLQKAVYTRYKEDGKQDISIDNNPVGVTDDKGMFTIAAGTYAEFGGYFMVGETYRVTEQKKEGFIQTIPAGEQPAVGEIGSELKPTEVLFENRTDDGSLDVTKTLIGEDGTELQEADKQKDFPFQLTIGGAPWADKEYTVSESGPDSGSGPAETKTTDANGGFTLRHGQTAAFTNLPYGSAYQVEEKKDLEEEGYYQTLPSGGVPATGMISDKKETVAFENMKTENPPERYEPLVIEKKLIPGEGVSDWLLEKILKEFNYDISIHGPSSQQIMMSVRILLQIRKPGQNWEPYLGDYVVSGPGDRVETKTAEKNKVGDNSILWFFPEQTITIPDLPVGTAYRLEEVLSGYGARIDYEDIEGEKQKIYLKTDQVLPENYGTIQGNIKIGVDNKEQFVNELTEYGGGELTNGRTLLTKYVDGQDLSETEWDDKYEDTTLTLRLMQNQGEDNWVPAAGVRYQILDERLQADPDSFPVDDFIPPIQTVGADGKIVLKPHPTSKGQIGGMVCLLFLNEGSLSYSGSHRLEEVEEETSSVFGKFNGVSCDSMSDSGERIGIHDSTEITDLKVEKKVEPGQSIPLDQSYPFQLASGNDLEDSGNNSGGVCSYQQSEEQIEAYRSYRLFQKAETEGEEDQEITEGGPFETDADGVFYLKDGQYALFEGLQKAIKKDYYLYPGYVGRKYHVKELNTDGYEVTVTAEGPVFTDVIPALKPYEAVAIPGYTKSITFTNLYNPKPGLTIYKEGAGGSSLDGHEFTFTLNVDGAPYGKKEYQRFSAKDNTEIKNYVTAGDKKIEVPWVTDEYGEFKLKVGQYAKFDWIGVGKHYEISETPSEEYVQVSPAPGTSIQGTIESTGNTETFINKNAGYGVGEIHVKKFLSFPAGLPMPDAQFQFRMTVDNQEYAMKEFTLYDSFTNTNLGTGHTDAMGEFSLGAGQYAVFGGVPQDVDYRIEELLPEDSEYRVIAPAGGILEGATAREGNVQADFINGIAAFMVTKSVTSDLGSTAPEGDVFTFEVKTKGEPLKGGRYWLYNDQNERVDDTTHTTNEKGEFTLQDGQKALFIGMEDGTEYEVRELPKQYYTQIVPVAGEGYQGTVEKQVKVLAFENRYSRQAAFSVEKQLKDMSGAVVEGDNTPFTFQLYVNGKLGSDRVYTLNDSTIQYKTDSDGRFTLRHGDVAHFSQLRDGDLCVIKEIEIPEGYTPQSMTSSYTLRLVAGESLGVDSITGTISPGVTEESHLLAVNRKDPTIWVENTTGDDTPDDKQDDNLGGTVAILNAAGVVIEESKNSIASGNEDDNRTGRYGQKSVIGMPEDGWEISLRDTTFGPMGKDGSSGAKYRIGDLPEQDGETAPETGAFYNPVTGCFRAEIPLEIEGEEKRFVIEGTLQADETTRSATVTIKELPFDMDLGFRFRKIQYELPRSGGSGNLPFTLTGLALMYLSAWELKRKRRK